MPKQPAVSTAAASADAAADAAPPNSHPLIAGYRVGDELGIGPLGKVYRAARESDGLKVVFRGFAQPADADARKWAQAREQFRRLLEVHRKQEANHPNVQQIVEFGDENGLFWIASEFFEGRTLHSILEAEGAQSLHWAIEVLTQVGAAVDLAASKGLAHTDLTPFNILLVNPPPGANPDDINVKVINFGLAQARPKFGSRFAAPEQQRGSDGDSRSDVWAAGALFYEIVSGRPVFDGMSLGEIVKKIETGEPIPLIHLPPYVQNVIATMLAKDPKRRYASVGAAISDLEAKRDPSQVFKLGDGGPGALSSAILSTATTGVLPPVVGNMELGAGDTHRGSAFHMPTWGAKGAPTVDSDGSLSGGGATAIGPNQIGIQQFSLADQDLVVTQWRLQKAREAEKERRGLKWAGSGALAKVAIAAAVVGAIIGHAFWLVSGYRYATVAGASGGGKATYEGGASLPPVTLNAHAKFSIATDPDGATIPVISTGAGGRVMLDLRGARIHLTEGTVLLVKRCSYSGGPIRRFALRSGRVVAWVDPNHRSGALFEIDSGAVRAIAKGTRFSVTAAGSGRVMVATEEGTVKVSFGDSKASVEAGHQLVVDNAGTAPDTDTALDEPTELSDTSKSVFAKSRKAMNGIGGGPGTFWPTLAVAEEKTVMPIVDCLSAVIHLPTTLSDRKAVMMALGSMQALSTATQIAGEAPASLHLSNLAEMGMKSADSARLLANFAGGRLLSYRNNAGAVEFRARAKDSKGTIIKGVGGKSSVVANDDMD